MVKKVADEFGGLDILVNNAGITRDKSLKKMTDEDWEEVIQTNLNGYFYCMSAAIAEHDGAEVWPDRQHQFDERPSRSLRPGQL